MLTPGADPVRKVSIIPRGIALGVTLSAPEADRFSYDRPYLLGKINVALGGRVAEELVYDEITTGAQNDIKQATELARNMVGVWGMSDVIGPVTVITEDGQLPLPGRQRHLSATQQLVDDEVRHLIEHAHEQVTQLMSANRDKLESLAQRCSSTRRSTRTRRTPPRGSRSRTPRRRSTELQHARSDHAFTEDVPEPACARDPPRRRRAVDRIPGVWGSGSKSSSTSSVSSTSSKLLDQRPDPAVDDRRGYDAIQSGLGRGVSPDRAGPGGAPGPEPCSPVNRAGAIR